MYGGGFYIALLTLLILAPLHGICQRPFKFIQEQRRKVSIPFLFERNLVIVPVYINDFGPFNFILDTGVSILIITDPDLRDSIGLEGNRRITIRGLGEGEDLDADIIPRMKVRIGKTEAAYLAGAVIDKDHFHLSNYIGIPIYGIIGYDFFSSFTVKINYVTSRLSVYHPDKFALDKLIGSKNYQPVPLLIENQRPYLVTQIQMNDGTSISSKLIIDSGAGHPILLEPGSNPGISVPDTSVAAMLGVGLNGPIHGHLGRLNSLYIGDYEIINPIASFPDYDTVLHKAYGVHRNGNIGNEVLKRFNVIFDYPRSRMLLKPNNRFGDPFEHDMSGMSLVTAGQVYRRYFIANIIPGSPADEAGLEVDDEILSINLQPAKEMSISEIDNL
ncbi:MAG TPA: aspartyl protease family protein, partial [Anseongella sp.]|nr:aspartyl protease family protein [Anseongella sp.]